MPKGKSLEWTEAMHRFCEARRHLLRRELVVEFNDEFGTHRSYELIRSFCKRNGYHTGRSGKFRTGSVPHNKGQKGVSYPGSEESQFRKGNRPFNTVPVGTEIKTLERPGKDPGYWKVKIGEPNQWIFKHRLLWQQERGEIPKGHALIFIDGNSDNVTLDNLALLTRGELAILNKCFEWHSTPIDHRKTVLLLARIQYISGRLERGEDLQTTENSLRAVCDARGLNYATVVARIKRYGCDVRTALAPCSRSKVKKQHQGGLTADA